MTSEQAALMRKARESLQAAQLLADGEFFDFAVSRAYYAMFYAAEALLLGEGLAFSKHSAVIAAFGQKFVKTGLVPPQFHRYLIEAEDSRNVGDYDIPGLTFALGYFFLSGLASVAKKMLFFIRRCSALREEHA